MSEPEPENAPCPNCGKIPAWDVLVKKIGGGLIEGVWTCPKCGYVVQRETRRIQRRPYIT